MEVTSGFCRRPMPTACYMTLKIGMNWLIAADVLGWPPATQQMLATAIETGEIGIIETPKYTHHIPSIL
jgi:hypothetical protein